MGKWNSENPTLPREGSNIGIYAKLGIYKNQSKNTESENEGLFHNVNFKTKRLLAGEH